MHGWATRGQATGARREPDPRRSNRQRHASRLRRVQADRSGKHVWTSDWTWMRTRRRGHGGREGCQTRKDAPVRCLSAHAPLLRGRAHRQAHRSYRTLSRLLLSGWGWVRCVSGDGSAAMVTGLGGRTGTGLERFRRRCLRAQLRCLAGTSYDS